MKLLKAIIFSIARAIVFIGIPLGVITLINSNYPGLLDERYLHALKLAMYLGVPIVAFYFLADSFEGIVSMIGELIALTLVLAYTLLLLGMGIAHISYENVKITLIYPTLLAIVVIGVIIRFPTPILKYLAWREENGETFYKE